MLKLQYFGHLMQRVNSLEKTLMLGEIEGKRRRGWQRMRWLDSIRLNGHEFEHTPGDVEDKGAWHTAVCRVNRLRHNLATEQQSIAVPFPLLKENISNICQGEQHST